MKLVYIAGPYRADDASGIRLNILSAQERAQNLARDGFNYGLFPVTPHLNTARFEKVVPAGDHFWLGGTMLLMEKCDIVLLVHPRSGNISKGTSEEIKRAFELGTPVYAHLHRLIMDAKDGQIGRNSINNLSPETRDGFLFK